MSGDTDTVVAITGGLLGARMTVPEEISRSLGSHDLGCGYWPVLSQ